MIKLKFSLGICLVLFSASADDLLFKAYKSYFNLSNKCEVRKVAYTFKGSDGDINGNLRWRQKSSDRFSLSFELGLLKIILTRNSDRLQLYLPHNKTLFSSSAGENGFSLASLMDTLQEMDVNVYKDFLLINDLKNIQERFDLIINKVENNYYIYNSFRQIAKVQLDNESLSYAQIYFPTGTLDLKFKKSSFSYLIFRNSKASTRLELTENDLNKSVTRALARYIQIRHHELLGVPKDVKSLKGKFGYIKRHQNLNLLYLKGNPYDIGWQHGKFLPHQSRRVVDSTLYIMGMVYSIKKGEWFLDQIRNAQARLDKFTPPEFIDELKGLADGSGIPFEEIHLANYFPALFHCSGYTVKDDKTLDGTLYHGRVLDYMCRIGLQYENAIFTVEKEGKIPFVNIGFAGFIGCVSGMNQQKISLGEMGGGGEGLWDGVPMPILMRMAAENANNLEEAKNIFSSNSRTCEYYYIFADGKDRSSTAVYAKPEKIDFLDPGEKHEKLEHEVPECLLIASGSRYEALHGKMSTFSKIDEFKAIDLMNAPVASATNNLHSVLFIPEKLKLWISYAGTIRGAYGEQFIPLDFNSLLNQQFYQD